MVRAFFGLIGTLAICGTIVFVIMWYEKMGPFAPPPVQPPEVRIDARTKKCLTQIVYADGRSRLGDHVLIAKATLNYATLYNVEVCSIVGGAQTTAAPSQKDRTYWRFGWAIETRRKSSDAEGNAYDKAGAVALMALKGDFAPYSETTHPWIKCITRFIRPDGAYGADTAAMRREMIFKFKGPNGTEFFCPKPKQS